MPTWCCGGSQLAVLPSSRFWLPQGNRTRKVDTMARIAMLPQIGGKKRNYRDDSAIVLGSDRSQIPHLD